MYFNIGNIVENKDFSIQGISYIGKPRSNTAMFITKKVERLLDTLENVSECLVFAEEGINVDEELKQRHAFVFSNRPQFDYARFATQFAKARFEEEKKNRFLLMPGGYYQCEDSEIDAEAYIEPGCVIGPDVKIGKNACILTGSVIRRSTIGDGLLANEYSVIGANGFTMTEDENGDKYRIPTLGRVVIGNNVEIGAHDNISCGSGGDTFIEDNVKIDALVHIGHDVHLHKNVEITAGSIIGGFSELGESSYVGINATLRNRIVIGEKSIIGMGATVIKPVKENMTFAGNPARVIKK